MSVSALSTALVRMLNSEDPGGPLAQRGQTFLLGDVLQAHATQINLNETTGAAHAASDGSSHTFIDQAVTIASTPVFGGLRITGGMAYGPITEIAFGDSPYTVLATDHIIYVDTSGGAVELDLPASAAFGRTLSIIRAGAANVTIDGDGAETVGANQGGGVNFVMTTDGDALVLQDTNQAGDEWAIVGTMTTVIAANAAAIVALDVEETDGEIGIPLEGTADAGTWVLTHSSVGIESLTRTAANAIESYWVKIPISNRTSADRGIKPTGLTANYNVDTADADDVRFEVWKRTQGADGAAPTAAVLFGEDNADYDAAHDTPAKRGDDTAAPELHKATITDAGAPAFLAANESLLLRVYVDGGAGGASDVVVNDVNLQFSHRNNDTA